MGSSELWGYQPDAPIPERVREVYSAVLPHFVEFVFGSLIDKHVEERRLEVARSDVRDHLAALVNEAKFCQAIDRPAALGAWFLGMRSHSWPKAPKDLRERRRKRPPDAELLREYEDVHGVLKCLMPRRKLDAPLSEQCFKDVMDLYRRPKLRRGGED